MQMQASKLREASSAFLGSFCHDNRWRGAGCVPLVPTRCVSPCSSGSISRRARQRDRTNGKAAGNTGRADLAKPTPVIERIHQAFRPLHERVNRCRRPELSTTADGHCPAECRRTLNAVQ